MINFIVGLLAFVLLFGIFALIAYGIDISYQKIKTKLMSFGIIEKITVILRDVFIVTCLLLFIGFFCYVFWDFGRYILVSF